MIFRREVLLCGLLAVSPVSGQELDDEGLSGFMSLLEFLGEFEALENENGEWIDPSVLANDVFANLEESDSPDASPVSINMNSNEKDLIQESE